MSYVQKSLLPDEKIVYAGTLHWIVFLPGIIVTASGAVSALVLHLIIQEFFADNFDANTQHLIHVMSWIASGITSLIGLAYLMGAFIRQKTTELAITNRRIIAKYGFISSSTFEIMLGRITGANFDQTIMGRIFGFGTVIVHGAGGDISPFDGVADPRAFQKALITVLGQQGNNNNNNYDQASFRSI